MNFRVPLFNLKGFDFYSDERKLRQQFDDDQSAASTSVSEVLPYAMYVYLLERQSQTPVHMPNNGGRTLEHTLMNAKRYLRTIVASRTIMLLKSEFDSLL